jgi:hypothetical protein
LNLCIFKSFPCNLYPLYGSFPSSCYFEWVQVESFVFGVEVMWFFGVFIVLAGVCATRKPMGNHVTSMHAYICGHALSSWSGCISTWQACELKSCPSLMGSPLNYHLRMHVVPIFGWRGILHFSLNQCVMLSYLPWIDRFAGSVVAINALQLCKVLSNKMRLAGRPTRQRLLRCGPSSFLVGDQWHRHCRTSPAE